MNQLPKHVEDKFTSVKFAHDGFKLTPKERDLAIALAMRSYTGETVDQIAERFHMSRNGVYGIIRNNPDFKRFQHELTQLLFDEMLEEAKFVVRGMLREKSPSMRFKAAELIFKSAGMLKSETTVKVEPPKQHMTLDELEQEQEDRMRRIIELEKELLD